MVENFLEIVVLNNSITSYLMAIATAVVGVIGVKLLQAVVVGRLKAWARRTSTPLDNDLVHLCEQFLIPIAFLGVAYFAINVLELHPILEQGISVILVVIGTVLAVRLLGALVEYAIRFYALTRRPDSPAFESSLNALMPAIRIALWAMGVVFLLDNFGLDIAAVVAGLGIGGIAIALAAQGVLQDLFSYFSIILDTPFEIGDFIIVGDSIGTVEYIGIKTTRIRSLDGEQLVIANTDLTASRIRNFKRMRTRRIVFRIGVTYETGLDRLKEIPGLIKDIVERTDNVTFDRAHFAAYGDFSLNFEVVYIVTSSDFALYMDAQQSINLALKQAFAERGIEFAYPTQVTYLSGMNTNGATSKPLLDGVQLSGDH
jgi:small-conductance mechanosensitive channel